MLELYAIHYINVACCQTWSNGDQTSKIKIMPCELE